MGLKKKVSRRGATFALLVTFLTVLALPPAPAHAAVRYLDEVFTSVTSTSNIVYGQAVNAEGQLQTLHLDLYQPTGDTEQKRPVFVWAHGGFFTQGDKSQIGTIKDFMAKRGWVTISIQYRLDPRLPEGVAGYRASEQLPLDLARLGEAVRNGQHDMQAAVRWVRANAATYKLDPDRIATGGHSAGASASVATAWNSDDPGTSGSPGYPSNVTAAIGTGPTDFAFVDVHPDVAVEPPVSMYHWKQDEAPKETQQLVCLVGKAMLNVCEVHAYPGAGHSSKVGIADWPAFLYKWVVLKTPVPHAIAPGTVPLIPSVHFPSSMVPTLPGVPII
jgi:predicted esterase